jgi:hypothetical protein
MRTGKVHTLDIDVTPQQIKRWESGEYIQHVMPHLSTADRVFIITGSTREEWDKAFKEKYEEDVEPDMEDEEIEMYEAQEKQYLEEDDAFMGSLIDKIYEEQAVKQIEQYEVEDPKMPKPAKLTEEKRSMLKQMWALDNNRDPLENTWTDKGYRYYRDHLKEIAAYYEQNAAYWKYTLEEEEYWNSHEADADSVAKQQDSHASDEPYNTEGRGL